MSSHFHILVCGGDNPARPWASHFIDILDKETELSCFYSAENIGVENTKSDTIVLIRWHQPEQPELLLIAVPDSGVATPRQEVRMAVIWDDSFKVGNTTIDNQHQTLFKWMNKLEDLLNGKGGRTTANDIISYLRTYTRTHFCYEELCMQRYSCPVAEKNSAAHDKFMEAFQKFETKLNADGVSDRLLRELHKSIEDWLVNHIYKIDTKLRACVTE